MTEAVHSTPSQSATTWPEANRLFLETALECVRLRLARRIHWLRPQWRKDPLQAFSGMVVTDEQADRLAHGNDREAEARFYKQDREAASLTAALEQCEAERQAQRSALIEAGQPSTLDKLGRLFELTEFELDVVLLCLAPNLDAGLRRLFAYVQDDPARQYPTPDLCYRLMAVGPTAPGVEGWGLEPFLPHAALRQYGLVELASSERHCPLSVSALAIDERMTAFLLGRNSMDERVRSWLRPIPPAPLAPAHRDLVSRLADGMAAEAARGAWPMINLIGDAGAGQSAVGRALGDRAGLRLFRLETGRLPLSGGDARSTTRLLSREAVLLQLAYYIDATEIEPTDRESLQAIDDILMQLPGPLILASREPWQTQREGLTVRMPPLDTSAQVALWEGALSGVPHRLNGEVHAMAQQFQFGPETIASTVRGARRKALLRHADARRPLEAEDLWAACRDASGCRMGTLCQALTSTSGWEDIVLPPDVLDVLRELASQVAHRSTVYESWGFGARLNRGRGISALFSGPSGTGKTMAAEILANHLRLELYRIDLASMVSKYIGETEKNLKKVFDVAEQSGAILFFDEADALFGKRTEVKDSHDRYANIEIDYLLQRMEAYRGLAILATNRKTDLDRAFLRRIRFVVNFPFPDTRSREAIWRKSFPPEAPLAELDFGFLARLEIAGGNVRNASLNAAFLAAQRGEPIQMDHLLHALRREYDKIEKLITRSEFADHYHQVAP